RGSQRTQALGAISLSKNDFEPPSRPPLEWIRVDRNRAGGAARLYVLRKEHRRRSSGPPAGMELHRLRPGDREAAEAIGSGEKRQRGRGVLPGVGRGADGGGGGSAGTGDGAGRGVDHEPGTTGSDPAGDVIDMAPGVT